VPLGDRDERTVTLQELQQAQAGWKTAGAGSSGFSGGRPARQVVNVAIGASYQAGRLLTFNGGFFVSFSPIGDPAGSPFQKADLYGGTLGAAVTGEHWSYSVGLAYEYGNSSTVQGGVADPGSVTDLQWRSLTLLYALAYRF
jgi:hypothetical protein